MKNSFKKGALIFILGGVALFAFGIFVGYQLNYGSISSLQGFLFNALSDVSGASASDSNASNLNASSSNASNSNASDANASSGNAQITDNIIYLHYFSLKTTSAKAGEKVYVNIETIGACNKSASIIFKNTNNGTTFTVSVNSISNNPYVVLPTNVGVATYSISDILLVGSNSNNSTFTKQYSISNTSASGTHLNFNDQLSVVADVTNTPVKLPLNSLSLDSTEAKVNDKVSIKVNTSATLSSLKLKFVNENLKEMVVYVKSLTKNPYFEIPSTTEVGTYNLISATLISRTATTIYSKDGSISGSEKFAFNSSIVVKDNSSDNTFIYNNEDLTEDIINKLYSANNSSTISINADSNSIISLNLFNAIKGTAKKLIINYNDNQIVFLGKNISNSKSIDVTVNTSVIKSDSNIGKLVNDGILLDFASNGDLPGKAQVRVKITEDMKTKLGNGKIYVYYYNTSCNDFSEIATEVTATDDGYYEFDIEHNSEYILVNKALDSKLITNDTSNVVSFQKSNKVYLLLIGLGILVIAGVTIGIVILKKKNKNVNTNINDNNDNNNLPKDDFKL